MNRLKSLLLAGGAATLTIAGIALVLTPAPAAAALTGAPPADCTFCAARSESCRSGGRTGWRTCYMRMSGTGSCPPCTPCEVSGLIDPFETE